MQNVVYYPDLVGQNRTLGDPKHHFAWGTEYYKMVKMIFPPDAMPRFFEGETYARMQYAICARKGVRITHPV